MTEVQTRETIDPEPVGNPPPVGRTATGLLADPRVQRAIELIWHEATLLDAKQYEAWNALYAEDGVYVLPIQAEGDDFDTHLNLIYDDARMRRLRVNRFVEGYSISAVSAARTVRTVSRFTLESVSDEEVRLRSAQVLVGFKRGDTTVLGADLTHVVRLCPDGDRIALKVVRLINSEDAVNASGYLL